jgi:putative hydrolase of the HAD superfamily
LRQHVASIVPHLAFSYAWLVRVETLFLDAGGVLVFPNWSRVSDVLAKYDVHVDASALAAAEPLAKQRIDIGTTIGATDDRQRGWLYFNLVLTQAGVAQSEQTDAALAELHAYHAKVNLWETVPPDVRPALDRLRGLGLRLAVISNANGTLRTMFDRLDLASRVDVVLDSCEEGVEKPDPRLFRIGLERVGGRAETTLHVGDIYHVDVVGARNAGLRAVLLDPFTLYEGYDCPRVQSLDEVADGVQNGAW